MLTCFSSKVATYIHTQRILDYNGVLRVMYPYGCNTYLYYSHRCGLLGLSYTDHALPQSALSTTALPRCILDGGHGEMGRHMGNVHPYPRTG